VLRLEVFKSNQHPRLTAEAVQQVIADYDPGLHKAPLTIGHVSDSKAPAWGWAEALTFDEPTMAGAFGDVDPDFEALWNGGHYRNISAAFYPPDHPDNPLSQIGKTGYYPHHFAALGAKAPKIKGLKNPAKFEAALAFDEGDLGDLVVVEFAEPNPNAQEPEGAIYVGSEDVTVIELDAPDPAPEPEIIENAEVDAWSLSRFMRGIRDYVIEKDGVEMADRIVPDYYIQEMEIAANRQADEAAAAMPTFSEGEDPMATNLEAREAELLKREANIRRVELTQFCETDLAKKIHPSQQGPVVELMLFCESQQGEALITFSEGDQEVSKTPSDLFQAFLKTLPDLVEFGELGGAPPPDFSNDPSALAARITAKVNEMASQGRTISPTEAAALING
jgi:hypothetical protein